ncbi:MAG: hypothetical protein M3042_01100 [Actinomycetota bacterium]|nr:hypothetical protein [Actinomycetota bacterium]
MRARHPTTSRLAWGSCLASACLVVLAAIFLGLDSFRTSLFYGWEEALGITFPLLGALIAARRPENRIGWLMCAIGLMVAVNLAVGEYTAWALGSRLHPPAVQWVGWINEWVWIPPFGAVLTLLLLLFPDGRLLSARWRVVAIAAIPAILTVALGQALRPGRLADFPTLTNPVTGSGSPALSEALSLAGGVVLLCCVIASLAALGRRMITARDTERQQVKWVAFAAAISFTEIVGAIGVSAHSALSTALQFAAFFTLPVAMGVAILRYRLYDIDRIVSRTVSYAVITGLLVVVYVGLVTAVTRFTPTGNSLAVAGSTLAVAALFQPLRRRVQAVVDRRFNRARYDAGRTIDSFSARLREQVDLTSVQADLLGVVQVTMQPTAARLWLRTNEQVVR